jgi:hypothetical protein
MLDKISPASGEVVWGVLTFAACALTFNRIVPNYQVAHGNRWLLAQTIAVLGLMTLAGYALVYFGDPVYGAYSVLGRLSRYQSAANLPLSILTAMALVGLLRSAGRGWLRHIVIATEAAYLALILAFSISHQADFVAVAEQQKRVVTQLAVDHPMMDPQATFIIRRPDIDWRRIPSIEYEDDYAWYTLLEVLLDFQRQPWQGEGPVIRIVHGDPGRRN